jgi:biopolymer transport protein ExbD
MHRLAVGLLLFSTACGTAPPPRPAESTAFVQDPARPNIVHGIDGALEGAPEVGLADGGDVTLDGAKIGKSDALGRALQQKKAERVAYAFDRDTPWSVVRSVLDGAAKAGHRHASFVTRVVRENVSHPSHLDVEVATEKKTTNERELHVTVSARGAVMLRWLEGTKQVGDVISTDAVVTRVAPHVEKEWNERGLYRDANDKRMDQVVLHVEPETAYALVITVLDGISATKRGSVPAFVVHLPADDKMAVPTIGPSKAR